MKVTITEYRQMPSDSDSNDLPLGGPPVTSQVLTAAGSALPTENDVRFVRVATDTAIHLRWGSGATTADPYFPANSVEYFGCNRATAFSIILG